MSKLDSPLQEKEGSRAPSPCSLGDTGVKLNKVTVNDSPANGSSRVSGEAVLLPSYEEVLRETGAGTARRSCREPQA